MTILKRSVWSPQHAAKYSPLWLKARHVTPAAAPGSLRSRVLGTCKGCGCSA